MAAISIIVTKILFCIVPMPSSTKARDVIQSLIVEKPNKVCVLVRVGSLVIDTFQAWLSAVVVGIEISLAPLFISWVRIV